MVGTEVIVETAEVFPETADIETSSDEYARRFSGEVGHWFLKVQEEATLGMLSPLSCPSVLDVGGGHGQFTEALLKCGSAVTILGSSESCRKRVEPYLNDTHCWFMKGNLIALPFPARHFDVTMSFRLLPHCESWKQLISELCRVATNSVIVDYPEVKSINAIAPWLFQWKKSIEKNTRPFTCFKKDDIVREFEAHGFKLADDYHEFFLPMVLHRVLRCPQVSAFMEGGFRMLGMTSCLGSPVILKFSRRSG